MAVSNIQTIFHLNDVHWRDLSPFVGTPKTLCQTFAWHKIIIYLKMMEKLHQNMTYYPFVCIHVDAVSLVSWNGHVQPPKPCWESKFHRTQSFKALQHFGNIHYASSSHEYKHILKNMEHFMVYEKILELIVTVCNVHIAKDHL